MRIATSGFALLAMTQTGQFYCHSEERSDVGIRFPWCVGVGADVLIRPTIPDAALGVPLIRPRWGHLPPQWGRLLRREERHDL